MHTSSMNHFWKSKIWEMVWSYTLILAMLTGCMPAAIGTGQVEALQPGTSLWIIQRASELAWGTIRMQKGDLVLLAAYMKSAEAWGYVILNTAEKNALDYWAVSCGATGNMANCKTMGDLVTSALNSGWKIVDTVPLAIVAAVSDSKSWLHVMPRLPILVLPGMFFDIPEQILPPVGMDT